MLIVSGGQPLDIAWADGQDGGPGLFVCSLVGLDRSAVTAAFECYLDRTAFTVDRLCIVTLIVDELTTNGVMETRRLYESPYTDHAPTGPDFVLPNADVDVIVPIRTDVRRSAIPGGAA